VNAGSNVVQVVQGHLLNEIDAARDVIASEPMPFVVAPAITSALPVTVARGATLTLTIAPQVGRAQHVVALIDAAAIDRVQDPKGAAGATGSVRFPIPSTMPTGSHLLRVEVDGVESRLVQDQTPGPNFGKFTGPLVTVT
jgi:hypothetical protein